MAFGQAKRTRDEFEELALPHLDALYALALRMTRSGGDAEDLVQDTLVRGYRFFHKFERGTNIKAWLFKILSNLFNNAYRNRSREREILAQAEQEGAIGVATLGGHGHGGYGSDGPEVDLLRRTTAAELQRALDALPHDFRLAVVLADLEELSYREIADIMSCPVGTVMSRLHRGRKLMREALTSASGATKEAGADDGPGGVVIPLRRRDGGGS
jgi:RNA polymerase sigma-70 factor (ECF subfamily)